MKNIKCVLVFCFLLLCFFVSKAQSIDSLSNRDTTHYMHVDSLRKQIVKAFLDSMTYPLKSKQIGEAGKVIIKITYQSNSIKDIKIVYGTAYFLTKDALLQLIPIFFEQLQKIKSCKDVHEITFPIRFDLGMKTIKEEKDGWIYFIEQDVKTTKGVSH